MPIERTFSTTGDQPEYRGMLASEWDLFRPNAANWPDIPFYRKLILADGQPALDIACASGRLILQYMSEGLDVDGVDVSAEMLEICRAKANAMGLSPNLYLQPMQQLRLPRRYRTMIVSSSSFALLTDLNDAREALARFFSHLESGGTLVMTLNLYRPDEDTNTWRLEGEHVRNDGAVVQCWNRTWTDKSAMLGHTETRYELVKDGVVQEIEHHRRSPEIRWHTRESILRLLEEAGFKGSEEQSGDIRGGYQGHPLRRSDQSILVTTTRP